LPLLKFQPSYDSENNAVTNGAAVGCM